MLLISHYFSRFKKYILMLMTSLLVLVGVGCQMAWSSNGLPRINTGTLAALAKQHPVIVLFRHAERCDRSDHLCLSDKTGITVDGANEARKRGESFSAQIARYDLYASPAVRTIQSATWFAVSKKVTVENGLLTCGRGTKNTLLHLAQKSAGKNVVVFTHNHCLSWLAKNMRGVNYDPDYLGALVMHVDKGKLYLDGQWVPA